MPKGIYVRKQHSCSYDGCTEPHMARGFCRWHYDMEIRRKKACTVEGCHGYQSEQGLCGKHAGRLKRNGHVNALHNAPRTEGPNRIHLSAYITAEEHEILCALAEQQQISLAHFLGIAIRQHIERLP